ncbi:hypothetical protein KCU93_g10297, partial [Aureobasidium melanogenum]
MTDDIRYFRVTLSSDLEPASSPLAATAIGALERGPLPPGSDDNQEEGSNAPRQDAWDDGSDGDNMGCDTEVFLKRLCAERAQYVAEAAARANVNPDANPREGGVERWMTRLGLDRCVAGLRKDEMLASYKIPRGTEHCDSEIRELCETSEELLWETYQSCQMGPQQRMTEP